MTFQQGRSQRTELPCSNEKVVEEEEAAALQSEFLWEVDRAAADADPRLVLLSAEQHESISSNNVQVCYLRYP